jgi:hypothetical protein
MPIILSLLTILEINMFGKILLTSLAAMLVLSGCSAADGANGSGNAANEIADVNVPIAGESLLADESERPVEIVPDVYEGSVLASIAYGSDAGVTQTRVTTSCPHPVTNSL